MEDTFFQARHDLRLAEEDIQAAPELHGRRELPPGNLLWGYAVEAGRCAAGSAAEPIRTGRWTMMNENEMVAPRNVPRWSSLPRKRRGREMVGAVPTADVAICGCRTCGRIGMARSGG